MSRRGFQQLVQLSRLLQRPAASALPDQSRRFLSQTSSTTSSQSYQALLTRFGIGLVSATAAAAATAPMAFASGNAAVLDAPATKTGDKADVGSQTPDGSTKTEHQIVFVLGGPGSGKGTQCARLLEEYLDVAHFSAGDLLRAFVKSGTPEGEEVAEMIRQGAIVPAEVTVGLLGKAIAASGKKRILIDGFPRNLENQSAWERVMGYDCTMVLFFDCPEEEMERRLLSRNQGRVDDNIETIKKRFRVFVEQTTPVVEHYEALGKVVRVRADRPPEVVFEEVKRLFA